MPLPDTPYILSANAWEFITRDTYADMREYLGVGPTDSPEFANLTLTSPSLASSAPVTISQTWDDLPTAFTALKVNATSTNSASGSLLLDLQVGGVSQFNVNKYGSVQTGLISTNGVGALNLQYGATGKINCFTDLDVLATNRIAFSDTFLQRDGAANTLALRNGAGVPQAFRVYNTYLGTTANEWFEIDWKTTAGLLKIGTTSGGTGVGRPIELNASGNYINFNIGTVVKFAVVSNRNLSYQSIEWNSDNTHDIGASGANRPRNLYVGSNIYASGNVGIGTTSPTSKLHVAETWNSNITVTSASGTGTVATVGFASTTVIPVGSTVVITGVVPAGYNGTYIVTVSTATSVSYANATTGALTTNGLLKQQYTALEVDITDTNSAASSKLLDLQVGGVSKFYVNKGGDITTVTGINCVSISGTTGFFGGSIRLNNNAGFLSFGAPSSVFLQRDDADNTLALRNSTAAQTFNVYGTYTSINDYRRLSISCDNTTGLATIATNKGSGTTTGDTDLKLQASSSSYLQVRSAGRMFNVSGSVNIYYPTGNSFIISSRAAIGGSVNTGMGFQVFEVLSVGTQNAALGLGALGGAGTANNNVGLGAQSGRFITGGSTPNAVTENSIYLGALTKAAASGETNQIVIGYDANGIGSHSVVLGNDSIEKTALKGNVGIGTTNPSHKLQVAGGGAIFESTGASTFASRAAVLTFNRGDLLSTYLNKITSSVSGGPTDSTIAFDLSNGASTTVTPLVLNGNQEIGLGGNITSNAFAGASMVIKGGNVGIGTTAPAATLHVNGADLDQDTKRVALFQSNDINIHNNFSVVGITSADSTINTFLHSLLDLDYTTNSTATGTYVRLLRGGVERAGIGLASDEFVITTGATEKLRVSASGNLGIGTTSPTSKLHVVGDVLAIGSNSPTFFAENTSSSLYCGFALKNTSGTGGGYFLNGSTQGGFGGPNSVNFTAINGPIAFHTASVTNALSIAQNGITTLASGLAVGATHASSLADFIASGSLVLGSSVPQIILNSTSSAQESRFASGGNGFFFDVAGHATASNNDAIFRTGQTNASYNLTEVFRITYNGLITFGGLANTVPAIKRSTVRLQARLADDSAFTNIQGKLTTDTDYTAGSISPTGFLTLYDAQGNAYKVPCVAA